MSGLSVYEVSMQGNKDLDNFKLGERPLKMPLMKHPFVVSPPQHINKIFQEYEKLAGRGGIFLLQYLTREGYVALRVCPDPFMREISSRVEIVSFNYRRKNNWIYLGCKIYSLRYLPMTDQEGCELSADAKAYRINYYFQIAKSMRFSSESQHYEKIARAISGRRVGQARKGLLRELFCGIFH